MEATPWEAIDSIKDRLKNIESEERNGNITTEQAIHLIGVLTTQYMDLMKLYQKNIAIIDDGGQLCFVHGEELEDYKLGNKEGVKFCMFQIEKKLLDIIVNNDLVDNKILLQEIMFGNINRLDNIIKGN